MTLEQLSLCPDCAQGLPLLDRVSIATSADYEVQYTCRGCLIKFTRRRPDRGERQRIEYVKPYYYRGAKRQKASPESEPEAASGDAFYLF